MNFDETLYDFDDFGRGVFLIPWAWAIFHAGVHNFLLEIAGDSVVANNSPNKGHNNRTVCFSVTSFHQDSNEAVDKIRVPFVDLDAGVSEGSFKFSHVALAGDIDALFDCFPQLDQFGAPLLVGPL